jgi:phospholipid/cholesterol/gamma-HCH transport system substrate-binding protein
MRVGERRERMPTWLIGLIMVVIIAIGAVIAYKKELPWNNPYEVTVTFASGQKLRASNPVRIAGVTVGKVTEVELLDDDEASEATASGSGIGDTEMAQTGGVKVTLALNEEALPLHEDALFKIRPRLFLEGNYFIDVQPGSPSAPTVEEGHSFPVNRTAYAVQLDQVLTTLQTDVRADLQTLLQEFGAALQVHGGADGLRALNRTGPLLRFSAQTAESFRGTERGDLPGMISGLSRVLGGLARSEENLRNLVTNFEGFTGAFAAQNEALGRAIDQLPDTLAAAEPLFVNLNRSFPKVRAFAREALPGTLTTDDSLRASRPFVEQLRLLMQPSELQGLVADLRPTVPELYNLGENNIDLFTQNRFLSSCFNEVVVPWSKDEVTAANPLYPHTADGEQVFESGPYGFTGTAVESRSGDANGQNLRVLGGTGANLVRSNIGGLGNVVSLTPYEILGAMPALDDSAKGPFKPKVPCETQEPPNLEGGLGAPPADQSPVSASARGIDGLGGAEGVDELVEMLELTQGLADQGSAFASSDGTAPKEAEEDLSELQEFWDALGFDIAAALGVERVETKDRADREADAEGDTESDPPADSESAEDSESTEDDE